MAPDLHGSRRAWEGMFPQNGDRRGTLPCTPLSVKTITFKKMHRFPPKADRGRNPFAGILKNGHETQTSSVL